MTVPNSTQLLRPSAGTDHVRNRWEDVISGAIQGPFLKSLTEHLVEQSRKFRILEIGSGPGYGLDYLRHIAVPEAPFNIAEAHLVPDANIRAFHGLEKDPALVDAARLLYPNDDRVSFSQWDPEKGISDVSDEPFDLYLCGREAFSHMEPDEVRNIIEQIADHAGGRAMVVMEWMGRFGLTHQSSWTRQMDGHATMETESGTIHLGAREEVETFIEETSRSRRAFFRITSVTDRAVFVGSPLDDAGTGSIRHVVNRLWEQGVRTPLDQLLIDYESRMGFGQVNAFYQDFASTWNAIVTGARYMFQEVAEAPALESVPVETQGFTERAWVFLRGTVRHAADMTVGDPRADFLEPYLASMLRDLELQLQKGIGCGDSLMVVAELRKTSRTS